MIAKGYHRTYCKWCRDGVQKRQLWLNPRNAKHSVSLTEERPSPAFTIETAATEEVVEDFCVTTDYKLKWNNLVKTTIVRANGTLALLPSLPVSCSEPKPWNPISGRAECCGVEVSLHDAIKWCSPFCANSHLLFVVTLKANNYHHRSRNAGLLHQKSARFHPNPIPVERWHWHIKTEAGSGTGCLSKTSVQLYRVKQDKDASVNR